MSQEFELSCYGVTEKHLEETFNSEYVQMVGIDMYVMGIMSDCQEILEHSDDKEAVRQLLNRAKYFLSRRYDEQRMAADEDFRKRRAA
jgi:hypothetical protein